MDSAMKAGVENLTKSLALELAGRLVGAYPDGVWLVELAPLSEGDLVAYEVAGALEVTESAGQPVTTTLVDA